MTGVKADTSQEDHHACECLILKLFLPGDVFGEERLKKKAQLMKDFRFELKDFQNRTGVFLKYYIWVLAGVSLFFCLSTALSIVNQHMFSLFRTLLLLIINDTKTNHCTGPNYSDSLLVL